MNLPGICEPLFQYMCRLSRSAQKGCALELGKVRSEIKKIFAEMRAKASASRDTAAQYEKVELPLVFYVDFMAKQARQSFSSKWAELAAERGELAGDEKFFDLLDADLADPSSAATERLAVYHTCLGLGFTGFYSDDPKTIRQLMSKISVRISGMMDSGQRSYICPQAYEHVDRRDFVEPPGRKLTGVAIILACLVIALFCIYGYLFWRSASDANENVKDITKVRNPVAQKPQ